jgi:hypothetical protein
VAAIAAVLGLGVVLVLTDDDDDGGASGPDRTTEISTDISTDLDTQDSTDVGPASPDDTAGSGEIPEAAQEPDGLGDDSELDGLAEDCFDGEMDACDDLFLEADAGSEYERYGDTCAGRQEAHTGVLCKVAFPG